jgi:hypothetical protein
MAARLAAIGLVVAALGAGCAGSDGRDVGPPPNAEPARLLFSGGIDGYLYTVDADGSGLRRLTRGRDWGARTVSLALADGSARVVDRRLLLRFASPEQPVVVDVAPDGRSFAFFLRDELRLYDLVSDTTRLVFTSGTRTATRS